MSFWVLFDLEFLRFVTFWVVPIGVFESFSYFFVFEFFHNLRLWVLSQFKFWSFVTFWVLEFCQPLSFFYFCHNYFFCNNLSFVTIWVFELCHNMICLVLSPIEFLSFHHKIFVIVKKCKYNICLSYLNVFCLFYHNFFCYQHFFYQHFCLITKMSPAQTFFFFFIIFFCPFIRISFS